MSSSFARLQLSSFVSTSRGLLKKLKFSKHNFENTLDRLPQLQTFFKECPLGAFILADSTFEERIAFKSFVALNPPLSLFQSKSERSWRRFIKYLADINRFYSSIGGVIGYYVLVLELLEAKCDASSASFKQAKVHRPPCLNLDQEEGLAQKYVLKGIHALNSIAFMAPVGGAGERLDLHDPLTREPLPVATLPFLGRPLLEGLIRDIQALEILYRKVTGNVIQIPIAFMTSSEKDNERKIKEICEVQDWFGRSPESFRFFSQPQVPLIDEEGHWVVRGPLELMTRPGGHGALWSLAEQSGTLGWLEEKSKTHLLIRQINNPIAGTDQAILALIGYGVEFNKAFGFIGCNQQPNANEGVDLLLEKRAHDHTTFHITNVEYSDFVKWGLDSVSESSLASFPANSNILFTSIAAVREGIKSNPIPSPLVNFKTKVTVNSSSKTLLAGRLETTMQNLADAFEDAFPLDHPLPTREELRTFLIYNDRKKTISVTKRQWQREESILETPEGAFFDLLVNNLKLLATCNVHLPTLQSQSQYLKEGPNAIFLFSPALGPLHCLIRKKIRGGNLEAFSELVLELSDLECDNLSLKGSLIVRDQSLNRGSVFPGFCQLKNVRVENEGIDRTQNSSFWKCDYSRKERVEIILHENSEFTARDVVFKGNLTFEALSGESLEVTTSKGGELVILKKRRQERGEQMYQEPFKT